MSGEEKVTPNRLCVNWWLPTPMSLLVRTASLRQVCCPEFVCPSICVLFRSVVWLLPVVLGGCAWAHFSSWWLWLHHCSLPLSDNRILCLSSDLVLCAAGFVFSCRRQRAPHLWCLGNGNSSSLRFYFRYQAFFQTAVLTVALVWAQVVNTSEQCTRQ